MKGWAIVLTVAVVVGWLGALLNAVRDHAVRIRALENRTCEEP